MEVVVYGAEGRLVTHIIHVDWGAKELIDNIDIMHRDTPYDRPLYAVWKRHLRTLTLAEVQAVVDEVDRERLAEVLTR